jgi:Flp pilus assembly pilin Flp
MRIYKKRERTMRMPRDEKGQMILEYSVMFVVVVAVIFIAAKAVIQPSVNNMFRSTARVIDCTTAVIENHF